MFSEGSLLLLLRLSGEKEGIQKKYNSSSSLKLYNFTIKHKMVSWVFWVKTLELKRVTGVRYRRKKGGRESVYKLREDRENVQLAY